MSVESSMPTDLDKSKRLASLQPGTKDDGGNEKPEAGGGNSNEDEKEDTDGVLQSSTATITSSTTSGASSAESRKSRRASMRRESLRREKACLFRAYDPMQVVTPEQLEGLSLLVSSPIWIFDFIEKKNRFANPAGLDLWGSPSLDEFLNRDMTEMSAASIARTQECQNRIEKAQVVQDIWTFYPNGKARTLQMTMTAVRLSPDEDHCCILVVGNMVSSSSSSAFGNSNFNSRSSFSNGSNPSPPPSTASTPMSATPKTISGKNRDSDSKQTLGNSKSATTNPCTEEEPEESTTTSDKNVAKVEEESKDEGEVEDEDEANLYCDENVPLNHILDNSNQLATIEDESPLNQEILRGVEIIRHLPIAVCQFDMKGRLMFQNPAAYLPPSDDEEEKEMEDEDSLMDGMDTDDESEYYEELFEKQYGPYTGISTIGSSNGRGSFLDRFVNKKVARELLASLQDDAVESRSNSITSVSSNVLSKTGTVSIEAELFTSTKGRTQWSSIQLRKTKDPVTSRPVILYSAQDKSDAMEAKREREARMQKSEFLAIMAHEIRTPLHQVTGFIDLLELDASGKSSITSRASSGAIATTAKNKSFTETDSSIKNAMFPSTARSLENQMVTSESRPNNVKKSRSTSLINTSFNNWPTISLPRQSIGNLTGEQKGYIKLLKSSANQLMTVINDVLDYSKLEAGKMKTERIPFELLSVVQGSMEAVRGNCEEKGLTLTLDYGGSDGDEHGHEGDKDNQESSGVNVIRKPIRRRRSFDGKSINRRRRIGRNHSFNSKKKNRGDNHPNIRNNDIPFRILGDPNRLRQVLLNLLSNAVKFTEQGGIHVRVSSCTKKVKSPDTTPTNLGEKRRSARRTSMSSTTSIDIKDESGKAKRRSSMSSTASGEKKEDGKIESGTSNSSCTATASKDGQISRSLKIIVTDTGMGISKEQQNTIFEKYQQANLSVARNFGGTGLGLSICKLLVEQTMGGTIGVNSDLGQGASFHISLPIEVPSEINDDTSRGVNGGKEDEKKGASLSILVAEDNKINQKLVANMLKRMGHKPTLVENGRQAIDAIVKSSAERIIYDAVLMDIQMPVMDGLEATRRLRTMGHTDLPILGLTASVKRSDYEELGFTDWLPKPILMKDLKAKLLKLSELSGEDSDE
eukprot:CAMPEP_0116103348 /NCGR_PEP_ID=MMETSP0327-20121206/13834_1 /TAXON_ID=44447 /ORGANISM="Pseudo-nitzschia delicatissima, Strain B596" /LENGTH=1146 /DNA_ID=CAMNT_0003595447 /DNA_START=25 /DNA_END=3465 /DNA_ORIENTATION=-